MILMVARTANSIDPISNIFPLFRLCHPVIGNILKNMAPCSNLSVSPRAGHDRGDWQKKTDLIAIQDVTSSPFFNGYRTRINILYRKSNSMDKNG